MLVPDQLRKCVVFLGYQLASGEYRMAGSAFYIGRVKGDSKKADPVYLVTARHVIDSIKHKGIDAVDARLNLRTGECDWLKIPMDAWFTDPSDPTLDVAIVKIGVSDQCDHLVLPYGMEVNDAVIQENEVGLGDEVFVVGLFRHHHGARRNIPIVRVGNLASMGEENVTTSLGDMDALLVEARSIGGLSGSPVFLNLGISRMIKGKVLFAQGEPRYWLLGLIHGHFDALSGAIDEVDSQASLSTAQVNTGIAIVVPFRKIDQVICALEAQRAG